MSHLLGRPETFFTPPHTMLYTGVALLIIFATIGAYLLRKNNKEIRTESFSTALGLLIIGSAVSLVAGPSDYLWHQKFGVDGLPKYSMLLRSI
jgi:ascorbate-specific PTS system EIIC-type component UlaA